MATFKVWKEQGEKRERYIQGGEASQEELQRNKINLIPYLKEQNQIFDPERGGQLC